MRSFEERLEQAKRSLRSIEGRTFPVQVVVESAAFCDFKCPACPSPVLQRARGFASEAMFRRIIDEIAREDRDTELWLSFMGEPLLYQPLFRVIRYAKDQGLTRTRLNTNANILNEHQRPGVFMDLFGSGLDRIIISLDGHSPETFNKIRLGGDYEHVKANVLELIGRARREGHRFPDIWVQMIVMDENAHEEVAFREFWLAQGVKVKIRPRFGWGTRVSARNLEELNIPRTFPCPWLMRQVVISWDGNILRCGSDNEARHPIGNLSTMSIKDAWNGELKRQRDMHAAGIFQHPLCLRCHDWKVGLSEVDQPREESGE